MVIFIIMLLMPVLVQSINSKYIYNKVRFELNFITHSTPHALTFCPKIESGCAKIMEMNPIVNQRLVHALIVIRKYYDKILIDSKLDFYSILKWYS